MSFSHQGRDTYWCSNRVEDGFSTLHWPCGFSKEIKNKRRIANLSRFFKCLKNRLASCLPYRISIGYYLAQAWESPLNLLWLHPDPCGVCGPLTRLKIPCHWLYAVHRLGSADFFFSFSPHSWIPLWCNNRLSCKLSYSLWWYGTREPMSGLFLFVIVPY